MLHYSVPCSFPRNFYSPSLCFSLMYVSTQSCQPDIDVCLILPYVGYWSDVSLFDYQTFFSLVSSRSHQSFLLSIVAHRGIILYA